MPEGPLLRLHDSSVESHVAAHSLQIAVWRLKPLFARLGVCDLLVPHQLIVLASCGLLEHEILWYTQRAHLLHILCYKKCLLS